MLGETDLTQLASNNWVLRSSYTQHIHEELLFLPAAFIFQRGAPIGVNSHPTAAAASGGTGGSLSGGCAIYSRWSRKLTRGVC